MTLGPGDRSFAVPVPVPAGADQSGLDLDVRARMTGPDADGISANTSVGLRSGETQPMLFRRGQVTGNKLVPAASFLFSRTERARFEFATAADATPGTARLLD